MAEDHYLLWTTKGTRTAVKDQDYLDPYSMYDFFNAANATRVHQRRLGMRARSAAPRIGTARHSIDTSSGRNSFQMHTYLRNPSPTPATSPPLSARSGQSAFTSATSSKHVISVKQSSPTKLYQEFHKTRCKSAPPRPAGYYLPKRPKTAKSQSRLSVSSFRNGPKRAWQNRTSSAKDCHSLLSPDEVNQRHKERCKSAPLPYDFSSIEHLTSVRGHCSDVQKLKALTRPLTCMPEVVQSVLSSNKLRHCCSAYHPRPKTSPNMRQQFWPVTRPAVFQRGNVPKYLHFVTPAGLWVHGADIHHTSGPGDHLSGTNDPSAYDMSIGTNLSIRGSDDMDEIFLHEEQFLVSNTASVESLSDQENWPELKVDGDAQAAADFEAIDPSEDLDSEFLSVGKDAEKPNESETQTLPVEEQDWDVNISQPQEQGFEITVTEVESLLVVQEPNKGDQEQRRPEDEEPTTQDVGLEIVVSEIPLEEKEFGSESDSDVKTEVPLKQDLKEEPSPVPILEEPSEPASDPVEGDAEERCVETSDQVNVVSKTPQVKFSEVLILTSFKAPGVKEETKTLPIKPILNPAPAKKQAALPPVLEKPKLPQMKLQKKTVTTSFQPKTQLMMTTEGPVAHKEEEQKQKQEEKEEEVKQDEPLKLEAAVLPQPEYIQAPGAYRMYEPKDLLQYQMEQHRESKYNKKSSTASMVHFVPSPESIAVMTSILDDQKRTKEGMKPWLQGRLALSRQTSRFELPMDVRLLEDMTPMDYLTKYCVISTRRKALYKHIFQKVDRDRDYFITFKEMDKGLKDVHVDYINTEQVKKLVEMVEGTEKSMFNLQQFSAIAAFSERLLLSESQANEKENVYSSKEIIEEADFCGLKAKLSGFAVNPTVRKILEVL